MKPPEDARTKIVNEWRRKADADMAVAERLLSDEAIFLNAVAFHCQQAAEKYLKALLTCWDIEFPKTHVLAKLLALVETRDPKLATTLFQAVGLTPYGVDLRYPGDWPDTSREDAMEAMRLAQLVRDSVLPLLPVGVDR